MPEQYWRVVELAVLVERGHVIREHIAVRHGSEREVATRCGLDHVRTECTGLGDILHTQPGEERAACAFSRLERRNAHAETAARRTRERRERSAAHRNDTMKQSLRQRSGRKKADRCRACRVTEDRDVAGIATERSDVGM